MSSPAIDVAPEHDVLDLDAEIQEAFDLDAEVNAEPVMADPAVTSYFVCTPGCTSPGGGSFCSYCC